MNNLKLKDLKNEFIELLHEHGIPEFKISLKEYKNNHEENLGCYRAMSQFRSNPIIYLDIDVHKAVLFENEDYDEIKLKSCIMDTIGHEYGHVMEEWANVQASVNQKPELLNKINLQFKDMEDFAEDFGCWLNKSTTTSESKVSLFNEVISEYVKNIFDLEAVQWVKQPKWKRALDYYLSSNEKSYAMESSFNKCKQVSESIASRICNICNVDIKILRLVGYKSTLENAHPKWKKIPSHDIIHYVVMIENDFILDLTSKQFDPKNSAILLVQKKDIEKIWDHIEVWKDYTQKEIKGFKFK